MTQSLIVSTSLILCLCMIIQISPLRPQRPRSQVLSQIGGDRRLSVSPGPPSSSSNSSSSSPGPPPITPRSKLSFSLHTASSKLSLPFKHTHTHTLLRVCIIFRLELPQSPLALSASLWLSFASCITVTIRRGTRGDAQFDIKHRAVCHLGYTSLNGHSNRDSRYHTVTSDCISLSLSWRLTPSSHMMGAVR